VKSGTRWVLVTAGVALVGGAAFAAHAAGSVPGDTVIDVTSLDLSAVDRVPEETWRRLSQRRIYFGHQSVGSNLLEGVADIRRTKPQVKFEVVETEDLAKVEGPVFAHSAVGTNCDSQGKIRDFVRRIEEAGPRGLDIAFFKFCYVDFTATTPVDELFATYRDAMATLERKHPATKFIHVTVPLMTPQTGIKAGVKRLLGKRPWGYEENLARTRFNDRLRAEYLGKRPFLDLAAAESTFPDGTLATIRVGDRDVPFLPRCYTDDGGHLNAVGRVVGARSLLLALAAAEETAAPE
jgi:hypothetical protein